MKDVKYLKVCLKALLNYIAGFNLYDEAAVGEFFFRFFFYSFCSIINRLKKKKTQKKQDLPGTLLIRF